MQYSGIAAGLLLGTLALASNDTSAACACFCVNGDLKTMCSSVEEAQANPTLCDATTPVRCPTEIGAEQGATYDPPHEAAGNCRDVRVFDPGQGGFTTVKACDVLSAG